MNFSLKLYEIKKKKKYVIFNLMQVASVKILNFDDMKKYIGEI